MTEYEKLTLFIASGALCIALISALFVFFQLRVGKKQVSLEHFSKIIAVNRELLTLGFQDPELFRVIDGKKIEDEVKLRKYLQLWVNQTDLIFKAKKAKVLDKETIKALDSDVAELFALQEMRKHWNEVGQYYSKDMQAYINRLINITAKEYLPLKVS